MSPSLTVVIPTLNEEASLGDTLTFLRKHARSSPRIIVVDGGSSDNTRRIAQEHGVTFTTQTGGRAAQLNAGAALSESGDLLFLHADTQVPAGYDGAITNTLARSGTSAGAFPLSIRGASGMLLLVQMTANIRARIFQTPYGDQGLFLRRTSFDAVGGFPPMPFLEDYEIVRRLRRCGRIRIAATGPVITSPRRWRALGVIRTTLMNQCIILGYHVGVPVSLLCNWYRGTLRRATSNHR